MKEREGREGRREGIKEDCSVWQEMAGRRRVRKMSG